MLRIVLCLLAILSLFLFPWPLTIALTLLAACFVPSISIIVGILADTLYFSPFAASFPHATVLGLLGFLIGYGVHQFVKTRIIG